MTPINIIGGLKEEVNEKMGKLFLMSVIFITGLVGCNSNSNPEITFKLSMMEVITF